MDKKKVNLLLLVASVALLASGVLFLCLSIFSDAEGTVNLSIALACILLANLLNIARYRRNKADGK